MSNYQNNPWVLHLAYKLLQNKPAYFDLFESNPFEKGGKSRAPKFLKADLYRYQFTTQGNDTAWWTRKYTREYFPPLSLDNQSFVNVIKQITGSRYFGGLDFLVAP
jgi:hypothetical protein